MRNKRQISLEKNIQVEEFSQRKSQNNLNKFDDQSKNRRKSFCTGQL